MPADLVARTTRAPLTIRQLRRMVPSAAYLHFLHQGIMTGFLPRFAPDGTPTGQFDNLTPRDRADLARYLLDKVMPDAPKEVALVTDADADAPVDAKALRALSTAELRAIANPATRESPPDLDSPITEAPPVPQPVPRHADADPR